MKLAYSPQEVLDKKIIPVGRNRLYELIALGEIKTVKNGRNIIIPTFALDEYLKRNCG